MTVAAVLLVTAFPAVADPGCDTTCAVAVADGYIHALVTHDARAVALHPRATRVEAGLPTGLSGEQIRADLEHGPQYRLIRGIRDLRYTVARDVVTADYVVDAGSPGVHLTTAVVHETFALDGGLIRRIIADITVGAS